MYVPDNVDGVAFAVPVSSAVQAAHGSFTARPAEAGALQQAVDVIQQETRPGDPVLLAPQLTALYVMTDRRDPLRQLSLLPGSLATTADEQRAIARMGQVRVVVTDRTPLASYGHGAFGTTFDQTLAAWVRRDFRLAKTVRGTGADARTLDIWIRSSP